MNTYFDCIPCLIQQALNCVRLVTPDEAVHELVLRDVLRAATEMDFHQSPPAMAQHFHRRIRELAGQSDPYRDVKDRFNRFALDHYRDLLHWIERSVSPMETAVRLAIAGNVIDFGVHSGLTKGQVQDAVRHALSASLEGDVRSFSDAVRGADDILYLADNAAEIVFDRLLIEQLPRGKVTLVVRGAPVSNDATMVDAEDTGLTELLGVIDNGSDAPGTILDDCSEAFRKRFDRADLIIAKGQGNYESLSEVEKDIYFLLKAGCPVIARDLGCEVGSLVLRRSKSAKTPAVSVGVTSTTASLRNG